MEPEIIYYLLTFIGSYLSAYSITIFALIIVYFFVQKKWKDEFINWLYVCNTIMPWITFAYLLIYAAELFIGWYGQNSYEWYAFSQERSGIWSSNVWSFWLMLSLNYMLPLLLWIKKLRKNVAYTFVMILVTSAGSWFERVVIYITSAYRDYLPSSWPVYNSSFFVQLFLNIIWFIILSSSVYWLFHKRKKLPFPSAILSYSLFFIPYFLFHCIQHFN